MKWRRRTVKLALARQLTGPAGTAMEIVPGEEYDPAIEWRWHGSMGVWFLDCPGQAAAWHKYILTTISLADVPGAPPAYKSRPENTHELLLYALDPESDPQPLKEGWVPLSPFNYVGQFVATDDEARELTAMLAMIVVHGGLWAEPPLSGMKEPWESMIRDLLAHIRGEHDDEHAD